MELADWRGGWLQGKKRENCPRSTITTATLLLLFFPSPPIFLCSRVPYGKVLLYSSFSSEAMRRIFATDILFPSLFCEKSALCGQSEIFILQFRSNFSGVFFFFRKQQLAEAEWDEYRAEEEYRERMHAQTQVNIFWHN